MGNIFFIDSKVADYKSILRELPKDSVWYLLEPDQDGVQQIANILAGYSNLNAIHIFSHGSDGTLYLGDTVLEGDTLSNYQSLLSEIGASLTDTGDILLYGCNVAATSVGQQFISEIASFTGADVAASSNLTGSIGINGDWLLEKHTGPIEASSLIFKEFLGALTANTAPTFDYGKVKTDLGSYSESVNSVAIQSDGKILVAGTNGVDFVVLRYNVDGNLDSSFGQNGKVITKFDSGYGGSSAGNAIALQTDGKIVVAGQHYRGNGDNEEFAIARYNSDGSLDTSFDGDGKATSFWDSYGAIARCIAIQPDGKLLVAGDKSIYFGLMRFNSDGSLDSSFDADGKVVTDILTFNEVDSAYGLAIQADEKILLVGGSGSYDFALARYNTNGSLDSGFDSDGKVTTHHDYSDEYAYYGLHDVALQSDGKIIAAGVAQVGLYNRIHVTRYNVDGSLDSSFDGDGLVSSESGIANGVAIQSDGKILVAGTNGVDFIVLRYNVDGSLDSSFDGDGKATTDLGSASDKATSISVQADGKIVLAGSSNGDFALVRYNPDGSLDTSFNPRYTLNANPTYTEGYAPVVMDNNVQVYDLELSQLNGGLGSFAGATLSLARNGGANDQDVFSASGNLSFVNGFASISGVAIGTVVNSNGALTISFFDGTQAQINSVLQAIAYSNKSDSPPDQAQIDWTFSDGNTGNQGAGGSLAVTGSITINLTNTNDAPKPVDGEVATTEDSLYTFSATDFPFNDPDLGSALAKVKIATLPTSGTLHLNGTAISAGIEVSTSILNAGLLTYVPETNATGAKTFEFYVSDGIAYSASSVMTINVSNVNDLPIGSISIKGKFTSGGWLLVDTTQLQDGDGIGNISYRWKANGELINGADNSGIHQLLDTEISKVISVEASYLDNHGTLETISASSTEVVTKPVAISGTSGVNVLSGTVGVIDTVSYESAGKGIQVNLNKGVATGGTGGHTLISIEDIVASSFNDTIIGNASENTFDGGAGNDKLSGGAGDDDLTGGDGKDKLIGGDGNDTYHIGVEVDAKGKPVIDKITEGAGPDSGTDTVLSDITYTLAKNVENLTLNTSAGTINGTGNKSANTIIGNESINSLDGKEGIDILTGNNGADVFVFSTKLTTKKIDGVITATNVDTITDFVSGTDDINLSKKIFKAYTSVADLTDTDLASFDSTTGGTVLTAADTTARHFLYDTGTGNLYYDADGSGNKAEVQFATLTGHPTLVANDLHIV